MIKYTSWTGTIVNVQSLKAGGWRWILNPSSDHKRRRPIINNMKLGGYSIDNGAWTSFTKNTRFDEILYSDFLDAMGADADWVTIPDVVEDRIGTLRMIEKWIPQLLGRFPLLMVVQDGMTEADIKHCLIHGVGIFIGGSTAWKIKTIPYWGDVGKKNGVWVHCGRVNTCRRIKLCRWNSIDSFDGSGVAKFQKHTIMINRFIGQIENQPSLFGD